MLALRSAVRCTPQFALQRGVSARASSPAVDLGEQGSFGAPRPPSAQPQLSVVANGLGSIVRVDLPPHTAVRVRPDAVLGHSSDARTFLALRGNPLRAAARRVAGGSFLLHNLYARSLPCDALLAPARLGDVAVLHLDGTRDYALQAASFLACTQSVTTGMTYVTDVAAFFGKPYLHASGSGSIAFTAPGGIFRLVLEEGESYTVSTRHLVAWDRSMAPHFNSDHHDANDESLTRVGRAWTWVKGLFRGSQTTCELNGPGDFFLSSRLEQGLAFTSPFSRKSGLVGEVPQPVTVTTSPYAANREDQPRVVKTVSAQTREESQESATTAEKVPSPAPAKASPPPRPIVAAGAKPAPVAAAAPPTLSAEEAPKPTPKAWWQAWKQ